MENRKNDLKSLEPKLSALNDETKVITKAVEDNGGKEDCPQQAPCVVR